MLFVWLTWTSCHFGTLIEKPAHFTIFVLVSGHFKQDINKQLFTGNILIDVICSTNYYLQQRLISNRPMYPF